MTEEKTQRQENEEHVRHIADDLERVALGQVYRDEDGAFHDEGDAPGGEVPEDWEPVDLCDWLEGSIYDTRFILDSDKEYYGVELMIACGGPNIWASTVTQSIELYWWGDRASWPLASYAVEALDELGRTLYED